MSENPDHPQASGPDRVIDSNMLVPPNAVRGMAPQNVALGTDILYAGLFVPGDGGYALYSTHDWDAFVADWKRASESGMRMVGLDMREAADGSTQMSGAYVEGDGAYALWRTTEWSSFLDTANRFARDGQRLADLAVGAVEHTRAYAGAWVDGARGQIVLDDLGWGELIEQWRGISAEGMRLIRVAPYAGVDGTRYAALFEDGDGEYALYSTQDWDEFLRVWEESRQRMQLVDFRVHDEGGHRSYLGVWRGSAAPEAFVHGLDWEHFTERWTELSLAGYRLVTVRSYASASPVPDPQWSRVYDQALGATAEGYAWIAAHDGVIAGEGVHLARSAVDGSRLWSLDTRINLASVSKPVTAVAVLTLVRDHALALDDPFLPIIAGRLSSPPHPGLESVTLRDLLQMKSGMAPDGALWGDLWPFLSDYLQRGLVGTPGETYAYSNTNFTILQGLIEMLTGRGYVEYVTEAVLEPMGIDAAVFNAVPDRRATATLAYSGAMDERPGQYWTALGFVAAGGWISSARELIKFLLGVRANTVLPPELTEQMFAEQLGWYAWDGVYGQYYHHNGGLQNAASPAQYINTGIVRFVDGWDAVLLVNSNADGTIPQIVRAFEAHGAADAAARLGKADGRGVPVGTS